MVDQEAEEAREAVEEDSETVAAEEVAQKEEMVVEVEALVRVLREVQAV